MTDDGLSCVSEAAAFGSASVYRERTLPSGAVSGINKAETVISPVNDFFELCAAFRLVHDCYTAAGYMEPHVSRMRYSILQLLPVSRTFVARCGKAVVGTSSVVVDSPAGLPSSSTFAAELQRLRGTGRRIAEGTMFACLPGRSDLTNVRLLSACYWWCRVLGMDSVCVVVNPKHLSFYQMLGFEALGETKSCIHVEGAPGILLHLDLHAVAAGGRGLSVCARRFLLPKPLSLAEMTRSFSLTEEQAAVLAAERPEVLCEASAIQQMLLHELFPLAVAVADTRLKLSATRG